MVSRPFPRIVLTAAVLALAAAPQASAAVRHYWISVENQRWDIAPNGGDPVGGRRLAPDKRVYTAVVYRRYTAGFRRPWPNTGGLANPGMPGPLITATVGDTVIVHFRNRDRVYRLPHSLHVHGFRYRPASDGSDIPFVSGRGGAVPVGGTFTYRYTAPPDSWGVWPYHDHSVDMTRSIGLGLYGSIAILRKGERPPDRRFVVFLGSALGLDTINGRAFIGNAPTFHARVGQRVEWDVFSLGDDFHVFHIHGHRWLRNGVPTDSEVLGPSTSLRVRFREENPGTWYYHCHVESHQMNGMIGLYRVSPNSSRSGGSGAGR